MEIGQIQLIFTWEVLQRLYVPMISIVYKLTAMHCDSSSYLWSSNHFLTIFLSQRHWVVVTRNVNRWIWTSIITEYYPKGYIGRWYPYSTAWENIIVVIIHIYWAISIILLLCHHQDTELESSEIEIGESGPVLTQKNTPTAIMDNDIHTLQHGRII